MCECPAELKFNVEAIDLLIRSHLLNMREFDLHLVQVSCCEVESVYFPTYGYARLFCWKFRHYSSQFIREVVCTIHEINDYPPHLVSLASINLIVIFCSKGGQCCPPFEQPRPLSPIAIGKWQAVDKLPVNWVLSGWRPCRLNTFSLPNFIPYFSCSVRRYVTQSLFPGYLLNLSIL